MKGDLGIKSECLISSEEIQTRVKEIAKEISRDYKDKDLVCVGILNGSYMFYADLTRNLEIDTENSFVRFHSYVNNKKNDDLQIFLDTNCDCRNRHILLIEDIIDTGNTIYRSDIVNRFYQAGALSVKIATLISKPSCRERDIQIDYLGFEIDDLYIFGYGLDTDNKGRNIEEIRYICR